MRKHFKTIVTIVLCTLIFVLLDLAFKLTQNKFESEFPVNNNKVYVSDVICFLKDTTSYRIHWEAPYSIDYQTSKEINYFIVYTAKETNNINALIDTLKGVIINCDFPYSNIYSEPINILK